MNFDGGVRRSATWILVLFLSACGAAPPPPAPPAIPKSVNDHFDVRVGTEVVHMQLAVLDQEQQRGLMERGVLQPNEGMIFVNAAPSRQSFWMHDTPTPLDIGFFTPDGRLAEIYPLLPFDERLVSTHSDRIQFALEMNQGWFHQHGVGLGAQIDFKALAAALKARGFEPAKYMK